MSKYLEDVKQGSTNEKDEIQHIENSQLGDDAAPLPRQGHGLLKSTFDEMPLLKTLWVFRRSALITLAVYTGYMCEGFEVSDS